MRCLHAISTALGPQRVAVVWFAALAVVAAGCGGAIPSSNGGPAGVKLDHSKLGQYLVDSEGHTLYLFERDEKGESYCSGACASVWPPFETDSTPKSMGGIPTSALGTIKRDDGNTQVTYRRMREVATGRCAPQEAFERQQDLAVHAARSLRALVDGAR